MKPHVRPARTADIDILNAIAYRSFDALLSGYFPPSIKCVVIDELVGVNKALLDRLFLYVAEQRGRVVGCGGWGVNAPYTSQQSSAETALNTHPSNGNRATVRSFFVDPDCVRQGVASALFERCQCDARCHGVRTLELMATIPGAALYRKLGFASLGWQTITLSNGYRIASERMQKVIVD